MPLVPARPAVGVGVFILDATKSKFLMSKRSDCGLFAVIGGHVERFESILQCAQRECLEESNLNIPISSFKLYPNVFNVVRQDRNMHYVSFFSVAVIPKEYTIINKEPDKHTDWQWFDIAKMRQLYLSKQLFAPMEEIYQDAGENLVDALKSLL